MPFAEFADDLYSEFQKTELENAPSFSRRTIATVGRLGPEKPGPQLQSELDRLKISLESYVAYHDLDEWISDNDWELGMVWAPFKSEIVGNCNDLTPTAKRLGVVDTVIRADNALFGINTNLAAAVGSIRLLCGEIPSSALLLGAGSTARSIALGLSDAGCTDIAILGRSNEKSMTLARDVPRARAIEDRKEIDAQLVVNATSVGESADGNLEFDISGVFGPGVFFFDVNQFCNNLQRDALTAGCTVQSGIVMQRLSHFLRLRMLPR